jgi:hypothetical protein
MAQHGGELCVRGGQIDETASDVDEAARMQFTTAAGPRFGRHRLPDGQSAAYNFGVGRCPAESRSFFAFPARTFET